MKNVEDRGFVWFGRYIKAKVNGVSRGMCCAVPYVGECLSSNFRPSPNFVPSTRGAGNCDCLQRNSGCETHLPEVEEFSPFPRQPRSFIIPRSSMLCIPSITRRPGAALGPLSKLLPPSPQVQQLSSPRSNTATATAIGSGATLLCRPISAVPAPAATPPRTGTPPQRAVHQSLITRTTGLFHSSFSSATPPSPSPFTRTYTTSSPRTNSPKISSSRAAQIGRHLSGSSSIPVNHTDKMAYTTRKVAAPYTLEHRVYIEKDGVPVSPFHDIPLFANQEQTILNMVVEIPRWTNAKLEVSCISLRRERKLLICHPAELGSMRPFTPGRFGAIQLLTRPIDRRTGLTDMCPHYRSPRRSSSTPSSRTSRRASSVMSATASPTRATCGTTAPFPR